MSDPETTALVLRAAEFAAHKHRDQRRKDADASPYINYPLALANVLRNEGNIHDAVILAAALLHDTLEDTETSYEELHGQFGEEVADVVVEVTDTKWLSKEVRKRLQISKASHSSNAGFRRLPGTTLQGRGGRVVYTPPQDVATIVRLMGDLERFINQDELYPVDPLIKMALIHHQFESIHPFYDGNGRTGRIINVLYLVKTGLLDIPILYASRYIVRHKSEYYRLLQDVRDVGLWEDWVFYMLQAIEQTAIDAIDTIQQIKALLLKTKHEIRSKLPRIYSQDLINNLFSHPCTRIEFIERDLAVSRPTAARYLDALTREGFLHKEKIGRSNYYANTPLYDILTADRMQGGED